MAYLVESKVKKFVHENDRRISKDGMYALELRFVEFLSKCCHQFNGHHKTITADLVNMMKI